MSEYVRRTRRTPETAGATAENRLYSPASGESETPTNREGPPEARRPFSPDRRRGARATARRASYLELHEPDEYSEPEVSVRRAESVVGGNRDEFEPDRDRDRDRDRDCDREPDDDRLLPRLSEVNDRADRETRRPSGSAWLRIGTAASPISSTSVQAEELENESADDAASAPPAPVALSDREPAEPDRPRTYGSVGRDGVGGSAWPDPELAPASDESDADA